MSIMLRSKTIDRICCAALVLMLMLTAAVWVGKASAGRKNTIGVGYEGLFDQSIVHAIDIEIADWSGFLDSATQETYTECSITIDGEKITNVGIRGKGNTSLSSVSSMGREKYSFKVEFDQYVKGRSYHGLDKLSLNNLIYDATMMKDYLAYTLMNRMGVPAPLCSFVQITVNGEPWGLYLAVEGVEDSFLERNNMTTGELYKPDSLSFGGGRGNGREFDFEQFRVKDDDSTGSAQSDSAADDQPRISGDFNGFSFGDFSFGNQAVPSGFSGQMPSGMTPPDGASIPGSMDSPGSFQMPGSSGSSDGSQNSGASDNSTGFQMPGGMDFSGSLQMPGSFGGFQMPEGADAKGFSRPDSPGNSGMGSPGVGMGNFSFGGGMFNFGMGNSDVKLQYIDDDPDSYSNIFDSAKTKITKKDQTRLIESLRTLSSDNAQDAVFADEVIRYLAVHDFLQNGDSYTGMMVHNYYLYEEDGKLAILPWDYNLAFGGMGGGGDASSTINSPIDSPVSSGSINDRPLVSWIFDDEESMAKYHEVYSQFLLENIESGWLDGEISRVSALIRLYVEADENSFYSVEEFDLAVKTLKDYCSLRGESVRGQLDGTIPSTSEGQRNNSTLLVNADSMEIAAMGTMNMGGGERVSVSSAAPDKSSSGSAPGGPSGSPSFFSGAGTDNASSQNSYAPPDAEAPSEEMPAWRGNGQFADRNRMQDSFSPTASAAPNGSSAGWLTLCLCSALLLAALIAVSRLRAHNS